MFFFAMVAQINQTKRKNVKTGNECIEYFII